MLLASFAHAKEKEGMTAARQAFEKIEAVSGIPRAEDIGVCMQTQQDALKAASTSERALLLARSSYCQFLRAALSATPVDLKGAALALTRARGEGKNDSAPLLLVTAGIAGLKSNPSAAPDAPAIQNLTALLPTLNCLNAGFAGVKTCNGLQRAGYLWVGWSALANNRRADAETAFRHGESAAWISCIAGKAALETNRWQDAALAFTSAASAWSGAMSFSDWLGPQLPPGELAGDVAWSRAMSGDTQAALAPLNAALAARPTDARLLFLRARMRESIPDLEAAIKNAPPNDAHFYRGVLQVRQHQYVAAALEFDAAPPRPDLEAWRSLTRAATGQCAQDAGAMDQLAASASPLFPKKEYQAEVLQCRLRLVDSLAHLISLDSTARPLYFRAPGFDSIRHEMADAYVRLGLHAENRKETDDAVRAYTRALEWDPHQTRAHFGLGAIHSSARRFDQAEAQYRAVLAANPEDREAQFWLGQTILASAPGPAHTAEACGLLQQSIRIKDSARRDQFATAISLSVCAK